MERGVHKPNSAPPRTVLTAGLEPATSSMSRKRSTKLSHMSGKAKRDNHHQHCTMNCVLDQIERRALPSRQDSNLHSYEHTTMHQAKPPQGFQGVLPPHHTLHHLTARTSVGSPLTAQWAHSGDDHHTRQIGPYRSGRTEQDATPEHATARTLQCATVRQETTPALDDQTSG